jgi:hypothetical protein
MNYDANSEVVGRLILAEVCVPDGPFRFIIGSDALFRDVDGNEWVGSVAVQFSGLDLAPNGRASEGSVTLAFQQDPDEPDLLRQIKDLGPSYVNGHNIRFYRQAIETHGEFYKAKRAPELWTSRIMRTINYHYGEDRDRQISLTFEGPFERRRTSRGLIMSTTAHARLIGEANDSLKYAPTNTHDEEKLWG